MAASFCVSGLFLIGSSWKSAREQMESAALQNHAAAVQHVEEAIWLLVRQENARELLSLEALDLAGEIDESGSLYGIALEGDGFSLEAGDKIPAEYKRQLAERVTQALKEAEKEPDEGESLAEPALPTTNDQPDVLVWEIVRGAASVRETGREERKGEPEQIWEEYREQHYFLCATQLSVFGTDLYFFTRSEGETAFRLLGDQRVMFTRWALAATALGGLLVYMMTRLLTRRLETLHASVQKVKEGQFDVQADINGRDEVGELSRAFSDMAGAIGEKTRELQEENRKKDEFISSFAHEVKTPLTGMMGYASLLQKGLSHNESLAATGYIISEGRRLENLVKRLFDLMMAGEEGVCLKRVYLPGLLEAACASAAPAFEAESKEVSWEAEDCYIRTDYELMKTVLINLLDNARKASREGQKVVVTGNAACLAVKDQGCGMEESEISRITEAFYTVDRARSRETGGYGLGLAICVRILAGLGAGLRIQSEPGKGTVMTIQLPVNPSFTRESGDAVSQEHFENCETGGDAVSQEHFENREIKGDRYERNGHKQPSALRIRRRNRKICRHITADRESALAVCRPFSGICLHRPYQLVSFIYRGKGSRTDPQQGFDIRPVFAGCAGGGHRARRHMASLEESR